MADMDKWGIPFWYKTAANAGVTGSGDGFFHQLGNDPFDESKKGFLRLGKEYDDVKVINSSTGEWMFPFAAKESLGDYIDMEGPTGHHSGGESHGCEGAEYRIKLLWNVNPAKFSFEKQMFHGGSQVEDPTTKSWTHPKVNYKIIGSGWNGFGLVGYNKKDGRSNGHDSRILECWWNPHPDTDIKDWTMLKRVEDKGGWGKGGDSCNGVSDQIFTWSNIQFRVKSGSGDFSLHPIKPEFEDGSNIHSIGDADMDFAACEKRGYGYSDKMPVNFEWKFLFNIDNNDGEVNIKNMSLREIDAILAPDDTPDVPTDPQETQTINTKLKLLWDLNTIRASTCQGNPTGFDPFDPDAGGGGGTTGSTRFYIVTGIDDDLEITNNVAYLNRTRVAQHITSSVGKMDGNKPQQVDGKFRKWNTPGASPTISCKIWRGDGSVAYTSPTVLDPSLLTTSYAKKSFDFSTNTRTLVVGDRLGFEYTGTSSSNYVSVPYQNAANAGTNISTYNNGVWVDMPDLDLTMEVWS